MAWLTPHCLPKPGLSEHRFHSRAQVVRPMMAQVVRPMGAQVVRPMRGLSEAGRTSGQGQS